MPKSVYLLVGGDAAPARGDERLRALVRDPGAREAFTAVGSAYLAFAEEVLRHLDDGAAVEPLTYFREPSLA